MLAHPQNQRDTDRSRRHAVGADTPSRAWHHHLPPAWREMVVAPMAFEVFRDTDLAAERCFGYDTEHQRCYYAHRFRIDTPRSDDGEEFYAATVHDETVAAWRLRDGRWLIHRIVRTDEHGDGQAFYCFSDTMPR